MSSLILKTTTQLVVALLLVFSVFLLLRGHDEPGGGFVGGLVAAAAFALSCLAHDAGHARRLLRVDPRTLLALGLLVAAGSGVVGLVAGRPFMTGLWADLGGIAVGTPFVFDVGVYLVVLGTTLTVLLSLAEE